VDVGDDGDPHLLRLAACLKAQVSRGRQYVGAGLVARPPERRESP
jgi:hypothetical protein